MGGQNSGRTTINFSDWMRDIERRVLHEERRPQIKNASDLMGPGLGPKAVRLADWNDDATLFNGFFFSDEGALHAPDGSPSNAQWMGYNIVNDDGSGYQQVYEYIGEADSTKIVSWTRRFTMAGRARVFDNWIQGTSSSGGGGAVAVADESTTVIGAASLLNFLGAGVTVTDGGAGQALITVPGSSGGSLGPGGILSLSTYAANFATSATSATYVDSPLSVTFTAVAGHTYRLTMTTHIRSSLDTRIFISLREGSTELWQALEQQPPTGNLRVSRTHVVDGLSFTAGSHTIKVSFALAGGTGSVSMDGAANYVNALSVEDITYGGGSQQGLNPYGSTLFPNITPGSSQAVSVTWASPLPDTNYTVITNSSTLDLAYAITARTTTGCTITVRNNASVDRQPTVIWEAVHPAVTAQAVGQVPGGYAEITANSPTNATTTPIDVPGLSFTVNLSVVRRYRVEVVTAVMSTVASDRVGVFIAMDGTVIYGVAGSSAAIVNLSAGLSFSRVIVAPTTGAHTFQVRVARGTGATGTVNLQASSTLQTYISIEDIGPA